METFDLIVLVPVAYLGFKGFQNGFVKEILSIVGIILAVFLTINYLEAATNFLSQFWTLEAGTASFAAGVVVFASTLIATQLIVYLINKVLEAAALSVVNKLAGLTFGALKAGLFVSLILILLAGFNMPKQETRENSITYSYLIGLAPASYDVIAVIYPGAEDFAATIQKTIDENNPLNTYFSNEQ
jgi:membrane protein required for colicin V production